MRWMEIAWENVGVAETAGAAATPDVLNYFVLAGRPDIVSDEVPWCAAFVNACLARAGISLAAIPREDRLMARKCRLLGTPIAAPRVGALAILRRGNDPSSGHVGFVTGWTATHVHLLGGNQANSVSIQAFTRDAVLEFRWPEPPATAKEIAAKGSRITAAATRQQKDLGKATGTGGGGQAVPLPASPPPKMPNVEAAAQKASGLKGAFEMFESFAMFAWSKAPWVLGAVAAYFLGRMAYDAWIIRSARVADHNEGRNPVMAAASEEAADGVL